MGIKWMKNVRPLMAGGVELRPVLAENTSSKRSFAKFADVFDDFRTFLVSESARGRASQDKRARK